VTGHAGVIHLDPTSPGSLNEKSSKPEVSAAEIGSTEPAEVKSATTEVVTSAGVAPREVHVAATGVELSVRPNPASPLPESW
jgi:hypothetical protein